MKEIGPEDLLILMKRGAKLFNGLPEKYQKCAISKTVYYKNIEFEKSLLDKNNSIVIVYCANSTCSAGHTFANNHFKDFKNLYHYSGGMYEWLLLNRTNKNKYKIRGKCKMNDFKHWTKL
tara:strand:- start:2925 stop:3284 length:360 start_codon:yes stop_codon:yes gene_type:complete